MPQTPAHRPATTADSDADVVVFLIGMRVNALRRVSGWWPVLAAMPRMLRELAEADLGLLDARSYLSGRTVLVVQYWRSFAELEAYAHATDHEHLPAWRTFNRRLRASGAVGIFHETYVVPASQRESVYVGMPAHGLARALGSGPLEARGRTAGHRLDPSRPDSVVVPV